MQEKREDTLLGPGKQQPFRVRLPGFLIKEEVGLGDVIKRVTYAMGIPACGGCQGRAETLNTRVKFTP